MKLKLKSITLYQTRFDNSLVEPLKELSIKYDTVPISDSIVFYTIPTQTLHTQRVGEVLHLLHKYVKGRISSVYDWKSGVLEIC